MALQSQGQPQATSALSRYAGLDQVPLTKEDIFKESLQNSEYLYTRGWILLDFPQTYEQAKLLERELSGFQPSDEYPLTQLEEKLRRAQFLARFDPIEITERRLIRGGVDYAIYLDIEKEESLRRSLGRRVDRNTNSLYHLWDNAPPVDNAPLMERLEQIRDFETQELSLVDKNCFLDLHRAELSEWFSTFGFYPDQYRRVEGEPAAAVSSWQEIKGEQQIDGLFYKVDDRVKALLEFKMSWFQSLIEKRRNKERQALEEEEAEKIRLQNQHKLHLVPVEDIQSQVQQIAQPQGNLDPKVLGKRGYYFYFISAP